MTTLQHAALLTLALAERRRFLNPTIPKNSFFYNDLHEKMPWHLLPDAIRTYVGEKHPSHFAKSANGKVSWIVFPDKETLKNLCSENSSEKLNFGVEGNHDECANKSIQIDEFENRNSKHRYFYELRAHLLQDDCLHAILREELIDYTYQSEDKFIIIYTGTVITGEELKKQTDLLEKLSFIRLVGVIYEKTGLLLTRDWLKKNVYYPLQKVYPDELARSTYWYMYLSDETDARIKNLDFEITDEEKAGITITNDLNGVLDKLHLNALNTIYYDL